MSACNAGVFASPESQLSPSQRTALLAAAIVYTEKANAQPRQFKSQMEYIAYKKAQVVANSVQDRRPVQSVIVSLLREFQDVSGCPPPS
jgi:hypothetical protein